MLADAMASAVSVMGAQAGLRLVDDTPGFEALVLTMEGGRPTLHRSAGFVTYEVQPPGGRASEEWDRID